MCFTNKKRKIKKKYQIYPESLTETNNNIKNLKSLKTPILIDQNTTFFKDNS